MTANEVATPPFVGIGRSLEEALPSDSASLSLVCVFLLLGATAIFEFRAHQICGIKGDVRRWFLSSMVTLDHVTDILAFLSFLAHGHGGFATWSFLLIVGSTMWGCAITAGELLDDELERRCSVFLSGLFSCQSRFWRMVSAKVIHHTEDIVMPFVSLAGLIPILSTIASSSEKDAERAEQKDKLAAQVTVGRALTSSTPHFLLTFTYLMTDGSWSDLIVVASATTSLIVAAYGLAAEAGMEEVGHFVLGGHYILPSTGSPSVGSPDLKSAQGWWESQTKTFGRPDQWRGRMLMGYLASDTLLRAIAAGAVVADFEQWDASAQNLASFMLMLGLGLYLTASAAMFPSGTESVGYLSLTTAGGGFPEGNRCLGFLLALYSAPWGPMTALVLSIPTYALAECIGSTVLCALLALFNLGALASGFFQFIGLLLLLAGLTAAKAYLFYGSIWPSFAPDGSQSYRKHLDEMEGGTPSPPVSTGKKAPSPGFTPYGRK